MPCACCCGYLSTCRLVYPISFLGVVDMLGSSFTDNTVATGFGLHLAQPILRKEWTETMTVVEGKKLLEECMKVLYYRDGRTINRVSRTVSNWARRFAPR